MANILANSARKWTWMNTTWLLFAALTAGLTFFVWVASQVKPEQKTAQKAEKTLTMADPLTQLRNHNPDELSTEVKPITFNTVVRDLRSYPPEFKDSRFLKANANKWTLQIMNVAEPEVIADYLKGREDRDKFSYFRIIDENNQKRYVLIYGLLNATSEAAAILNTVQFNLPNNVKAFPEQIKLYTSEVDEYEVAEPMKDLSQNVPREVKLHTAPKLIPAPKAKVAQPTPAPVLLTKPATTPKPATTQAIKESPNKEETLSIQEKKVSQKPHDTTPIQPAKNTNNESKNTESKNQDNNHQASKPATQAKPKEAIKETAKEKSDHQVDSIEKVIKEKSQ